PNRPRSQARPPSAPAAPSAPSVDPDPTPLSEQRVVGVPGDASLDSAPTAFMQSPVVDEAPPVPAPGSGQNPPAAPPATVPSASLTKAKEKAKEEADADEAPTSLELKRPS